MSPRRTLAALAASTLVALAATIARADTPIDAWDAARDPEAQARWELHAHVRRLLMPAQPELAQLFGQTRPGLLNARILLEKADAARSPDVRLRFDLGEVYYRLGLWQPAIDVLGPAIAMAPDHPSAPYGTLANAYGQLDRPLDERRVYEDYLPRITSDREMANALLNYAEADMHLGDLGASIAHYRESADLGARLPNIVALSGDPTEVLAMWGLAVALDRSGDVAGGAAEARLALRLDDHMQTIGHHPDVFFSPERERYWYLGLGYVEYAKSSADAAGSAVFWRRAERCWKEYVDDAEPPATLGAAPSPSPRKKDLWVDLARARLDAARAQRKAAERRVGHLVADEQRRCVD